MRNGIIDRFDYRGWNVLLLTRQSNRYHNWEVSSPIVKRTVTFPRG